LRVPRTARQTGLQWPIAGKIEAGLDGLDRANARSPVVDGVAAVLRGDLRTTAALDLVTQLERETGRWAMRALSESQDRPGPRPGPGIRRRVGPATVDRDNGRRMFSR
jgi:hypothetical protein